jgi:hypothetical protein
MLPTNANLANEDFGFWIDVLDNARHLSTMRVRSKPPGRFAVLFYMLDKRVATLDACSQARLTDIYSSIKNRNFG